MTATESAHPQTDTLSELGKTISALRKSRGVTQETLAEALGISAQSVSKWETGTTMPDISLLPAIADYFDVSIDYLFRGETAVKGDFLSAVTDRVIKRGYDDGFDEYVSIAAAAFNGLHAGNMRGVQGDALIYHGDANGLAGLDRHGNGSESSFVFGMTRSYFSHIDAESTADHFAALCRALDTKEKCLVLLAVIAMDDASIHELPEITGLDAQTISHVTDALVRDGILTSEVSKHKSLGVTYHVQDMRYPALVLIAAAVFCDLEASKNGYSCCLGKGDFPIQRKTRLS